MPKEMRQDFVFELFGMFYKDFCVAVPREILAELPLLCQVGCTSRIW